MSLKMVGVSLECTEVPSVGGHSELLLWGQLLLTSHGQPHAKVSELEK